jgi:hypothetical protein
MLRGFDFKGDGTCAKGADEGGAKERRAPAAVSIDERRALSPSTLPPK